MEHTQNTFIINKFVSDLSGSKDENLAALKAHLKANSVFFKDYEDVGLLLIYNDFNKSDKSDWEKECRSLVMDRDTLEIVSYSCSDPICNADAKHYLLNNDTSSKQLICQCYEGTLMHLFNHNGEWFYSTRRCLYSGDSVWKSNKSHDQMFQESLKRLNITDLTEQLSTDHCYYFILMHHENINVVDYTSKFGENYAKLALAIVREKSTQLEIDIYDQEKLQSVFPTDLIGDDKIIIPEVFSDMTPLEKENNKGEIQMPPQNEGLLIKVDNVVLKFQTADYLFGQSVGPDQNIYKGFLKLYQTNDLGSYLQHNKNFEKYRKIQNPTNKSESFDTKGMVDAVFKTITSESFELFKILYDIRTGHHKNSELYSKLPPEMKQDLFQKRGAYFAKKAEYINNKKNMAPGSKVPRCVLKISDIYDLFKNYNINDLEAYLKSRRLMINLVNREKDNTVLQKYKTISNKCDKVHLKLTAIYTSKLFPDITSDDVYEGWNSQASSVSNSPSAKSDATDEVVVAED